MTDSYLVATSHPWNVQAFGRYSAELPGRWHLITDRAELTPERVAAIQPRYLFLPHWSWMVPDDIWRNWECVAFHEADLPFGRGGSPIQNLIARGHDQTMVSAFRVSAGIDDGPVYLKRPLSLLGSAEEIFIRSADTIAAMIAEIVATAPYPVPQAGEPVTFKRRKPEMSEITPDLADLSRVHDLIRMLDAPGYPHAFLKVGPLTFKFTRAALHSDRVTADVEITIEKDKG